MKAFLPFLLLLCGLPAVGGELVVAVSTEPPTLDPTANPAAAIDLILHHNLYECLVQVGPDGDFRPQLAESWEASADGRTWTFRLRRGVRFHDGTPFDAEAVRRSFLRAMSPDTPNPHPEYYADIAAVEAVDAHTVRFQLKEPVPYFLAILAQADSAIVPKPRTGEPLGEHPVGTGPFRFVEWRPGDRIVLERNPDYYMPEIPRVDRVSFRFIPDGAARALALQAGDVDIAVDIPYQTAKALEGNPAFTVVSGPMNLVQILAINNARTPFADLRVRQAIAHAIDREKIIELVALGYATPIGGPIPPGMPYYVDLTDLYPYDPERARELLAEAGYPRGFEATMTLPSNYEFHVKTGELIAAQLGAVGIGVSIRLVDWGTWLERVYAQADYDLTVIGHIGRLDPALMLTGYGAERPDYYFRRGWRNAELEELLEEGKTCMDPERRREIYARAQRIIAEEVVNYFIQDPHRIIAARAGIGGLAVYPIYVLDLTRVSALD
ncbi:MAG: ABC transporter substrate-binding protein [Caldiserica bacterium]|nr:ABC transporter substrate-binding protein [Caldisericota bacterium]